MLYIRIAVLKKREFLCDKINIRNLLFSRHYEIIINEMSALPKSLLPNRMPGGLPPKRPQGTGWEHKQLAKRHLACVGFIKNLAQIKTAENLKIQILK